jgi:tRNA(fMet)-specific endonuclease VapC
VTLRYLLDTNIVSDIVRNPQGRVAQHAAGLADGLLCTSIIVAAELRYGVAKKDSDRLTRQLEVILSALDVLPLEPPADRAYGRLRAELELAGQPIGPNDLLIAAQALSLDLCLVSDNEREFARVKGLRLENWLR